jgi:MSHA biogenesis protein MshJ
MKHLINTANDYINNLSLREKLLLLAVVIAAIYSVWDLVFFTPYIEKQRQQMAQQKEISDKQVAMVEEIAKITSMLKQSEDPNKKLQHDIKLVKQESVLVDEQLNEKFDKLIPPTQITALVKNILSESEGLRLLSLENKPVEVIELLPEDQRDKDISSAETAKLYKHTSTIKFLGDYRSLYQYLVKLESSDWNLYWDQLQYEVTQYPFAEISLSVHTVSKTEHWIGL